VKRIRIAAYVIPKSLGDPTGQAKHAINMLLCLARRPDVELTLLAGKDQLTDEGRIPEGSPLHGTPVRSIPAPAKGLHFLWRTFNWPPVDLWCGKADWVYSPTEMYVPARKARIAATVHCVNWFEDDLPWSHTKQNLVDRRRMARVFLPLLQRADLVVTVSEFLKRRICELFQVNPERVAVVGNGVEDCFFEMGRRAMNALPPAGTGRYVFAVAYPDRRKGFDRLIELADELARRNGSLRVRVAGSGLAPGQSLAEVRRLWGAEVAALLAEGLKRPNLELLGYRPADEIARLMQQSVAVLVLSRYETFGIPALEAMAAGAPVIAAHHAGLPEVVSDVGVIVDPSRIPELADLIMRMESRPDARAQATRRGRARAEQFTWDACADKLVGELRRRA
jgi:glycosyltransferase involved in cell wall biosynthesis